MPTMTIGLVQSKASSHLPPVTTSILRLDPESPMTLHFWGHTALGKGFPGGSVVKNLPAKGTRVQFLVEKIHWRRKWQPTPVFLLGESHRQRSLMGYSPKGCRESNTTEQLSVPTAHGKGDWPEKGSCHAHCWRNTQEFCVQ